MAELTRLEPVLPFACLLQVTSYPGSPRQSLQLPSLLLVLLLSPDPFQLFLCPPSVHTAELGYTI